MQLPRLPHSRFHFKSVIVTEDNNKQRSLFPSRMVYLPAPPPSCDVATLISRKEEKEGEQQSKLNFVRPSDRAKFSERGGGNWREGRSRSPIYDTQGRRGAGKNTNAKLVSSCVDYLIQVMYLSIKTHRYKAENQRRTDTKLKIIRTVA